MRVIIWWKGAEGVVYFTENGRVSRPSKGTLGRLSCMTTVRLVRAADQPDYILWRY